MGVVKFASVLYLFFISCFFTFNVLQAYPEFRPDKDNKLHHHRLGWANKHHNFNHPHLSPEMINLYIHLDFPAISNNEYADLRKLLLTSLSTKEFLDAYNEFQIIRDWIESEDLILRIFQDNDYNKVKTLITGFDLEHFITWYPSYASRYKCLFSFEELY